MTKLRVLVFGGRDYNDAAMVDRALSMLDVGCIIHGGARGADTLAGEWGKRRGLPVLRIDASWDTYAVGFPGGAGTRDMAHRCTAAGVPLWRPVP